MFDYNSLRPLNVFTFDGKTPANIIVSAVNDWDVGEYFNKNSEAFVQILGAEATTGTAVKWNLKFVGLNPPEVC